MGAENGTGPGKKLGFTGKELLNLKIPQRPFYLYPLLQTKTLSLIYAKPGVGKSLFCLSLAIACASRQSFLAYEARERAKVCCIDGEMSLEDNHERLRDVLAAFPGAEASLQGQFKLITTAHFPNDLMPPLTSRPGQEWFEAETKDYDLIIIDNLGCVAPRMGNMTDEQAWIALQPLLVRCRNYGKSVLIVHHAGKSGDQLGTSMKMQVLDLALALFPGLDEKTSGVNFTLTFQKVRGKHSHLLKPLFCRFEGNLWTYKPQLEADKESILKYSPYMSAYEIAAALGAPLERVKRVIYEAKQGQGTSDDSSDAPWDGFSD